MKSFGRYALKRSYNQSINQTLFPSISIRHYQTGFASDLFANRVCVISGGNGGIGRECGRLLAMSGARVALLSRNKERAEQISQSINQSINEPVDQSNSSSINQTIEQSNRTRGECRGYECDVTDVNSIQQTISQIRADLGDINVLICSHGVSIDAIMASPSINQSINETINVNLIGSLQLARGVHRSMMRSLPKQSNQSINQSVTPPTNSILFVSSIIAKRGNIGQVAYAASKAGLTGAVSSLSAEWWPRHSIRVNAVEPGPVDTDMLEEKQKERFIKEQSNHHPRFRIANPLEVANVCAFLSSDLASYITGTTIEVAGGMK